jgi:formylglycine-generating enzyme required for sulfatase activity
MQRTAFIYILNFVLLAAAISTVVPAVAQMKCEAVLLVTEPSSNDLKAVITSLAKMRHRVDLALAAGQKTAVVMTMHRAFTDRMHDLIARGERHGWTRDEVLQQIREEIQRIQDSSRISETKEAEKKEQAIKELEDALPTTGLMTLQKIPAGTFETQGKKKRTVTIEQFWMSDKLVTQRQWALVASLFPQDMALNPSVHYRGPHTEKVELLNGESEEIQPENPVEYVTAVADKAHDDYYYSVYNFIDKLNELSKKDHPLIGEIIKGHKKGMVYDLPTEDQFEYVATDFGNNKTYKIAPSKMDQHAHFGKSYKDGTAPVASKLPFLTAGGQFFDLQGNVWIFTKVSSPDDHAVLRGGSYSLEAAKMKPSTRDETSPVTRSEHVGFRLIGHLPAQ